MKSELEQEDIELIAQRVIEKLKPLLWNNGKREGGEDIIFTVESLSQYLQVDTSWIYKAVSLKTVPYFKNGKYTRFRKREIDKWIDAQTVKPIPQLKILTKGGPDT
jgi:excisionase family DNA binding protein